MLIDELRLVAGLVEPALQPHRDHERHGVSDVDALVDGRAARVDADRPGRRRQIAELAGERVVEAHRTDRTQAPPALAARARASSRGERGERRPELGAGSAPVSASRSDRRSPPTAFSSRRIARALLEREPLGSRLAQLAEALERRERVSGRGSTVAGSRTSCAYARASTSERAPRRAGAASSGADGGRGELLVAHRLDRVGREAAKAGEVELDVVLGQVELLQVRAHRLRPGSRPPAGRRRDAWPWRFESFFPSGPSRRP